MDKKICVIGGGRWGKNHIRTLAGLGCLAAVVEADAARLKEYTEQYPGIKGYADMDEAIACGYDGYTVALPAELHYPAGRKLLEKGLNVMLEKPMTLTAAQSAELVELAQRTGARLMVGHVLLFHPAYRKIKEVIDSGRLGKLFYLYSNRLNLGTVRTEESVFPSFAPHDISVLDYLTGASACRIEAKGAKFLQDRVYDSTLVQLEYPGNVHAHIYVSWLHPYKQQLLVVAGSKGMLSFDDAADGKEIRFYNKRIDFENGVPVKVEAPDEIIPYEKKMPLEEELRYSLGQNVNIANNVKVGNGVRIQNNVSVYEGVELEDNVFCGPSCVFTNVVTPRAHFPVHGVYAKTLIKEGASLGANSTVVCGHTVGRSALIAAGAVVTKDVQDYALMAGVPARRIGWVCECGARLDASLACSCGRKYKEENGNLLAVPSADF